MDDDFGIDFDVPIGTGFEEAYEPEADLTSLEEEAILDITFSEQETTEILNELSDLGIEPMTDIEEPELLVDLDEPEVESPPEVGPLPEVEPPPEIEEPVIIETAEALKVDSVQNWISDINPNYDPFDYECPYNENCGSCALAVWNRLNGGDTEMVASAENIGYNYQMEAITGMQQVEMSPDAIKDYLIEQGAGANGIVGIDRADGPGHWFNAYNDGGRIVAIDGQTGTIEDWPPQDLGNVIKWELSI